MPPIVLAAIAFACGVAASESVGPPRLVPCALAVAAALALLCAAIARRRLGLATCACAFTLGALDASLAHPVAPPGLLRGGETRVTARVTESAEEAFDRTHVTVALEAIARGGRERSATGLVRVGLDGEPVERLLPGDRVRFEANLIAPRGHAEPDAPDPARRAAERGLVAVAGLPSPDALARVDAVGPAPPESGGAIATAIARGIGRARERLLGLVARSLAGDRRALVESLVLGERRGISRSLDDAFRAAGVNHVLSVSGLHLAMVAWLVFVGLHKALARVTPLARRVAVQRVAALCALPLSVGYAMLTGSAIATLRSLVVSSLFLGGVALGRPAFTPAAFALAALALLGASPLSLYDPSFQLSFAAALGVALLAPAALARLWPRAPERASKGAATASTTASAALALPCSSARARWRADAWALARRALRALFALFITSAAAILATAPLTAWHFAQVAPAGLVANLVVVPLAELFVLPAGLAGCVVGTLVERAGRLLLVVAGAGAAAMAGAVRLFAALLPAGHLRAPTLLEAALFYAALVALYAHLRSRRRGPLRLALALAAAFAATGAAHAAWPRLVPSLTVRFLDVGQADACFVELPDGRTMLVDGGGSVLDGTRAHGTAPVTAASAPPPSLEDEAALDPGAQIIVPWLLREGVSHVDYVVLTHPHPDHAGALAAVVARFRVREVWTNGEARPLPALARLLAIASKRGVPVVPPHALDGPARLDVLAPLVDGEVRVPPLFEDNDNDGSIVLRLRYGGRAILLTGDIEKRAESRLDGGLEHPGRLDALAADVVKAPHHGSRTSSTVGFVEATGPRVVVFSVGQENRWGFPHDEVLARWAAAGASLYRTDRDGAVTVRIARGGSLTVETAR